MDNIFICSIDQAISVNTVAAGKPIFKNKFILVSIFYSKPKAAMTGYTKIT